MLHAPISESAEKNRADRNREVPEPQRELHPAAHTGVPERASGRASERASGRAGQLRPQKSNTVLPRNSVSPSSALSPSAAVSQAALPMTSAPRPFLQAKLKINEPGDRFEQEADKVAEKVMRMPAPDAPVASSSAPVLQRKCACEGTGQLCSKCKAEEEPGNTLHRKAGVAHSAASPAEAPPIVHEVVNSPGQPLDAPTRAFFEPRFGCDFSHVRVHTGSRAAESALSVNALAYTVNHSVAFGAGSYAPHTVQGRRLLAHELAHVVQQGRGSPRTVQRNPGGSSAETQEKISKAATELDRLQAVAKTKGKKLSSEDALAAYDAVHSVVMTATSGNDADVLEKARQLKSRLDSIVHDTDAAKPPSFAPHPAASQEPMTAEESTRAVTAQRGFDAGLNQQGIEKTQQEIEQKQNRLNEVEAKLKTLPDDSGKAGSKPGESETEKLRAERSRLQREIASAKTRIAVSKPTLIDADPEKLRAQKKDLEAQLQKTDITDAQRRRIQKRINVLQDQITGLTAGPNDKVPPASLQGGKLGGQDLSSQDSFDRLQSHQKTYVTVQVVGPDGKLRTSTFQARNDPQTDRHAEDIVMEQLKKMPKSVLDGATIIVTGDQEICDRCAPRLQEFAKEHGGIAKISGVTAHAPKLTSQQKDSGEPATAKTTTAKVSDPVAVEKMEKAQEEAGRKKPGEPVKQTYKETTIHPTEQNKPPGPAKAGGSGEEPSTVSAGKPSSGAKPATSTVSKPDLEPPAPRQAPKKPATKGTTSKTVTPSDETAQKPAPKKTLTGPELEEIPHTRGGTIPHGTAFEVAKHAVGGAGRVFTAKLEQLVRETSNDKDLNAALDTLDTAVDVQSFVESPLQFGAQAVKSAMIQGVFNHFSRMLAEEEQKFVNKFPDVETIHKDPLDQGISLENYEKFYEKTRLDLRIPVERKVLLYALVLLGTNKDTPDEEIKRRIEIANQAVLNLPDIIAYARRFSDARQYYSAAGFSVLNKENVLLDQLAEIPSSFPAELRRRGKALTESGKALTDLSDKIMNSGLVVFDPVFAVATELETLGKGFSGLGDQFEEFADLAGRRKNEYETGRNTTYNKGQKLKAQWSNPF